MTYDELRLQQLLGPFNKPQGIATLNPLAFQYQDQLYPDLQSTDVGYSIAPPGSADEGYAIGPYGTADDFFGTGFAPTSDIGFPSVTRGNPKTFQDFYSTVYEPYDPEKDDEQVSYNELTGKSSIKDSISSFIQNIAGKPGISSLIGFINPLAGVVSKGLGYLGRNLSPSFVGPKGARPYGSESIGGLFARSNTLADFFQNVRDKRARDAAAARGAAKQNRAEARALSQAAARSATRVSNRDAARGNPGGGGGMSNAQAAANRDAARGRY